MSKITLTQLKKIIKEEISNAMPEQKTGEIVVPVTYYYPAWIVRHPDAEKLKMIFDQGLFGGEKSYKAGGHLSDDARMAWHDGYELREKTLKGRIVV